MLAASTVGGNLSVTARTNTGTLTQSGVLTVTGTSSFTTTGTGSGAGITLTQTNVLAGAVSLNTAGSNAANLTNGRATLLGASTIGGALTVTDLVGNLTQSATVLTVTGTSPGSRPPRPRDATITLNSNNVLTGAVSLNTNGTSGKLAALP